MPDASLVGLDPSGNVEEPAVEAVISATAAIADPINVYRAIVPVLPYDPHCLAEEVPALLDDPGAR